MVLGKYNSFNDDTVESGISNITRDQKKSVGYHEFRISQPNRIKKKHLEGLVRPHKSVSMFAHSRKIFLRKSF